jgi:hypothetical protein
VIAVRVIVDGGEMLFLVCLVAALMVLAFVLGWLTGRTR